MNAHLLLSPQRVTRLVPLALLLLVVVPPHLSRADEPVTAVFKARELSFFYRSAAAAFPCHELKGRVAAILRAVGARDDVRVDVSGCDEFLWSQGSDLSSRRDDPFDRMDPFEDPADRFRNRRREREQSAHVRVQLMTPVEVTPEVLAEIDKDKSRRELISRVTGNPAAGLNDPIVFEAQRQSVTLSRRTIRLEPEDCELLEQMTHSVFREINVRVTRGHPSCNSREPSRIAPEVTVEALLPTGMLRPLPEKGSAKDASKDESASDTTAPDRDSDRK